MRRQNGRREATRIEQVASQLDAGALKDHLQRYVASQGQAMRMFEATGDPLAIDVILENVESIVVLARELRNRVQFAPTSYTPERQAQTLIDEFNRRKAAGLLPGQ